MRVALAHPRAHGLRSAEGEPAAPAAATIDDAAAAEVEGPSAAEAAG